MNIILMLQLTVAMLKGANGLPLDIVQINALTGSSVAIAQQADTMQVTAGQYQTIPMVGAEGITVPTSSVPLPQRVFIDAGSPYSVFNAAKY